MSDPARSPIRVAETLGMGLVLAAALAIRLLALQLPGHSGDVAVIVDWAERMAEHGSTVFYDGSRAIYPALLYLLWPLGLAFDGEALSMVVKGMSIPFDLGIGAVLFAVFRRRSSPRLGLAAASLYLFNPGIIVAGPVWGQVDAAGTLAFLGALIAVSGRHHAAAGGLATLATLFKPQFGLVVLAVGVVVALRSARERRIGPVLWTVLGGAWTYGIVAGPLALGPLRYLDLVREAAERQPITSLFAFNPWAVLIGFEVPDEPYVGIGLLLLVAGLLVSLLPLRRRADVGAMLAVGGMMALAFYFLPTRVHERYLFPVLALLAPFAAAELRLRIPYVVLSLAYALSLVYTLDVLMRRFELPVPVAAVLVSAPAVWVLSVLMLASALVFFIVFLADRPPRLDADDRTPVPP